MISPVQEALIGQVFESYLTQHHQEDILQLLAETSAESHCPVPVNAMTLFEANMEVIVMSCYINSMCSHLVLVIFVFALKISKYVKPQKVMLFLSESF